MLGGQEEPKRSPTLQFLAGFFAGIGIGLGMFVLTLFLEFALEKLIPKSPLSSFHSFAAIWAISSVVLFVFVALSTFATRASVFRAGLVTAFALIMLLDVACWSFQV